jgi:hypothetical protein
VVLLLIAVWVRSYYKFDHVWIPISSTRTLCVITDHGDASVGTPPIKYFRDKGDIGTWGHTTGKAVQAWRRMPSVFGVRWTSNSPVRRGLQVIVPLWMPTTIGLVLCVGLVWKHTWRFSLRTLLIAITLIGLILGFILATTR